MYQTIENKQKFISQIMTGKSPARSVEDVDEQVLSYAEIKALATGNPLIKEKMTIDVELQKLKMLEQANRAGKYAFEKRVTRDIPDAIQDLEKRIASYENDITHIEPAAKGDDFRTVIGGTTYTKASDAGAAVLELCNSAESGRPDNIGSYRGFNMLLRYDITERCWGIILGGAVGYTVRLGDDARGVITRLDNTIDALPQKLEDVRVKLDETREALVKGTAELGKPFALAEKLSEMTQRARELEAELKFEERIRRRSLAMKRISTQQTRRNR